MLLLAAFPAGCLTAEETPPSAPTAEPPDPPACPRVFVELPGREYSAVKGQVLTRTWEPLANATVEALYGPGGPRTASTDAHGCYHLVVPWGVWTIRASAEGYETDRRHTEIREQERDRVDFFLKRSVS